MQNSFQITYPSFETSSSFSDGLPLSSFVQYGGIHISNFFYLLVVVVVVVSFCITGEKSTNIAAVTFDFFQ